MPPYAKLVSMKRPLSLLEVAIGMALTAILLTALFSTFRQLVQTNASVQKIRNERHWTYVTHLRLGQIFETTTDIRLTDSNTLIVLFNNGIDPEPAFCGQLGSTLFIKDDKLTFKMASPKGTRFEPLCDNVKDLSFSFYDTKAKKWVNEWKGGPLCAAIAVTINDETFSYTLPHAERRVIYP